MHPKDAWEHSRDETFAVVGKLGEGTIISGVDRAPCAAATLSGYRPLFPAMQDFSYTAITDLSAVDTLSIASDLVT